MADCRYDNVTLIPLVLQLSTSGMRVTLSYLGRLMIICIMVYLRVY